jgi:hypothetical protein
MRMAAGLALLLAACAPASTTASAKDNRIDCAVASAASFTHDCTIEWAQGEGARLLIVRHPDGRFRRFELAEGSLKTADGSEPAQVSVPDRGKVMDVTVGQDRYRIPLQYDEPNF